MEWWQLSPEEISQSSDALKMRKLAYYNTFYATEEGRQVLLDIKRMCYNDSRSPDGLIAMIQLFHTIRGKAGLTVESDKAGIDAEAGSVTFE